MILLAWALLGFYLYFYFFIPFLQLIHFIRWARIFTCSLIRLWCPDRCIWWSHTLTTSTATLPRFIGHLWFIKTFRRLILYSSWLTLGRVELDNLPNPIPPTKPRVAAVIPTVASKISGCSFNLLKNDIHYLTFWFLGNFPHTVTAQ